MIRKKFHHQLLHAVGFVFIILQIWLVKLTCQADSTLENKQINKYFYYISTNEGILSHYQQLEQVWNAAICTNRSIYLVGFQSERHYPDVPAVHMCDIFALPSNIECISTSNITILQNHKCIYTGENHTPDFYGWDGLVQSFSKNFNYSDVECVAGPTSRRIGIYNRPRHDINMTGINPFHKKYLDMIPLLRKTLGIDGGEGRGEGQNLNAKNNKNISINTNANYITAHWRRGDQLKTRCKALDKSVNCQSEQEMTKQLEKEISEFIPKRKSSLVKYICTDETDPITLEYLRLKGYKTFSDIRGAFAEKLTSVDIFMIELVLMCDSSYFFAWGISSVNSFLFNHCRGLNPKKRQVTIFDGIKLKGPRRRTS